MRGRSRITNYMDFGSSSKKIVSNSTCSMRLNTRATNLFASWFDFFLTDYSICIYISPGFYYFYQCMVVEEASNCFLTFVILRVTIALCSMILFCFGFWRLESEWAFFLYPAERRLSSSRVSFETAVRLNLFAPVFY